MNTRVRPLLLCCWVFLLAGLPRAQAQWLTQKLDLKAGWNAVFLHVDASYASINSLLAADPDASIEEIWLWMPDASTQQFVQSPAAPTASNQWLSWSRTQPDASALQNLVPNAAYLVRVRSEIATYQWQLKGKPVLPRYQWTTSGLNFFGFPTVPTAPPSFDSFLAQAPAEFQRTQEIFRYQGGELGATNPVHVFALRTTPVKRGEAYWVRAGQVYNNYYGPFEVVSGGAGSVDFGDSLKAISLRLRNLSPNPLTVTLNLKSSEAAPGEVAILPVPPLLLRGELNPTNLTHGYSTLVVGTPKTWTLTAVGTQGSEAEVVLGLDRSVLAGNVGDLLAGLLQFTDSLGQCQVDVGVSAKVGGNAGLWVGGASVSEVGQYLKSYARDSANNPIMTTNGNYLVTGTNTDLGDVAATYPLRLIVHSPGAGSATLFQRIFYGFNAVSNAIVANQEASLNRDLLSQSRRISATQLPFSAENDGWAFSGPLVRGGALTASVTNRFNDQQSNPFLHTYHPDHDNLDSRFEHELPQGSESYTVLRDITLNVMSPLDDFDSRTAADQTLNGQYSETIRLLGLARAGNTFDTRTFKVRGSFTLNRITDIATVTRLP
ncbi:MAG TPA: hypothetical protein VMB21_19495 [Candidatus Limnocylindria bacterium]|nr:hypothetical protein [Candidatus Limnocylindria bacterium]